MIRMRCNRSMNNGRIVEFDVIARTKRCSNYRMSVRRKECRREKEKKGRRGYLRSFRACVSTEGRANVDVAGNQYPIIRLCTRDARAEVRQRQACRQLVMACRPRSQYCYGRLRCRAEKRDRHARDERGNRRANKLIRTARHARRKSRSRIRSLVG